MKKVIASLSRRIGSNRGIPRVYLEGALPEKAGFTPGTSYTLCVDGEQRRVVLRKTANGVRVVSKKLKGDRTLPVIDLNSREALGIFEGLEQLRVVIMPDAIYLMPLSSELRRVRREDRIKDKIAHGKPLLMGSCSHGGGILSHALHQGLAESGVRVELMFANDFEQYLEHAASVNDAWSKDTISIAMPVQELAADKWLMDELEEVDLFEAGIPCSGASAAGKAKKGLNMPEAHDQVGHLVAPVMAIIAKINPAVCLFENVTGYRDSASAYIMRYLLRDMGYRTTECEVSGSEWGLLENRKRWILVGVSQGIKFDLADLKAPPHQVRFLREILEAVPEDDPSWSKMEGLKAKEVRDKEAGKGFAMQVFHGHETSIGTLTKGLAKNRSTDPKIAHGTNPDLLRLPTPGEHAAAKGVPKHLIEGLCKTTAHEVLGQSIIYTPFQALGKLIGRSLKEFATGAVTSNSPVYQLRAVG